MLARLNFTIFLLSALLITPLFVWGQESVERSVNINEKGEVKLTNARVYTVGTDSIIAVSWLGNWIINTKKNNSTKITDSLGNALKLTDFKHGDLLNAQGKLSDGTTAAFFYADKIELLTSEKNKFRGEIKSLSLVGENKSFVMVNKSLKELTVNLSSSPTLKIDGQESLISDLEVGMSVEIIGVFDKTKNTIMPETIKADRKKDETSGTVKNKTESGFDLVGSKGVTTPVSFTSSEIKILVNGIKVHSNLLRNELAVKISGLKALKNENNYLIASVIDIIAKKTGSITGTIVGLTLEGFEVALPDRTIRVALTNKTKITLNGGGSESSFIQVGMKVSAKGNWLNDSKMMLVATTFAAKTK